MQVHEITSNWDYHTFDRACSFSLNRTLILNCVLTNLYPKPVTLRLSPFLPEPAVAAAVTADDSDFCTHYCKSSLSMASLLFWPVKMRYKIRISLKACRGLRELSVVINFKFFCSTGGRSKNKWHSPLPTYSSKMDYSVLGDKGS